MVFMCVQLNCKSNAKRMINVVHHLENFILKNNINNGKGKREKRSELWLFFGQYE